ncbi:hypothetical protein ACHAXT_006045 [Thalassiosira profunda]
MMVSDKLSDRLQGMLLEAAASSTSSPPSSSARLIELVEERPPGIAENEEEEDDGPPPIHFHGAPPPKESASTAAVRPMTADAAKIAGDAQPSIDEAACANNEPSLAEQLLADANAAKEKQKKQQSRQEQQRAEKSTFGMKKGFLNASKGARKGGNAKKKGGGSTSDAAKTESKKGETDGSLIYELDGDGNMIPSRQETNSNGQPRTSDNPLQLPDVQSAMLDHLQSNSSQWATPDLLDSIARNHPKLARGMNDPRYMAALQSMQTHPKETLEKLQKESPEIGEWLMEFCGVLGEHFAKLGKEQGGQEGGKQQATGAAEEDAKVREMGPLEEKALKAHQLQKEQASDNSTKQRNADATNEMDSQVASILGDEEMRSILLDPNMQRIMEECTQHGGSKLRYYLGHEEYGPKLRRLMDAGLLRLA